MSAPTLSRKPSRAPTSPPATRAARPTWRDPRLAAGIGLVALCALLGARIVGGADNTVAVWSVRTDLVAGQDLVAADLESARVRFADAGAADRYVSATDEVPGGTVLTRDLGAGELLPRAAMGAASDSDLVEVPVTVPAQSMPATLRAGDLVDVWVTPEDADQSVAVFSGVRVLSLPSAGNSLSPSLDRQVILGLDKGDQDALPVALGRLANGSVVVTSRVAP